MRTVLIACSLIVLASPLTAQDQDRWTNSVGMEFIRVEPGTMQVAVFHPSCPAEDEGGWSADDLAACRELIEQQRSDGFEVTIEQPYYLGRFEVTQGQWQAVMGHNPATFADPGDASASRPVESISWAQAQAFVAALNAREGTEAYRLPSEFEWEFACRAGGPGQQTWEAVRTMAVDGGESLGFGYGRTPRDPALPPPTPYPVGSMAPNAWGFHDMLGNVWEWVEDGYNESIFPDPQPPQQADTNVLKGASFVGDVKNAICATHGGGPGNGWDVGLRIARSAN